MVTQMSGYSMKQTDLGGLHKELALAFKDARGIVGIGTAARSGEELEFSMVWIRMDEGHCVGD
jgi:hypothetical protein